MPLDTTDTAALLSIRALAYDGDADFVIEHGSDSPITAAHRFRAASAPAAARVAEQLRIARDLLEGAAFDTEARHASGQALRAAVIALRELAESYDIAPVAEVCRARESGAMMLDPRAVAGIEHVAHGLLGAAARDTEPVDEVQPGVQPGEQARPATAEEQPVEEAPAPAFRPPTGTALVELLEHGISGIERWPGTPLDVPAVPAPATAAPVDGVVPIDTLYYRGPAALARAREVRDTLRAQSGTPDPELLAELYDLLDLVGAD